MYLKRRDLHLSGLVALQLKVAIDISPLSCDDLCTVDAESSNRSSAEPWLRDKKKLKRRQEVDGGERERRKIDAPRVSMKA